MANENYVRLEFPSFIRRKCGRSMQFGIVPELRLDDLLGTAFKQPSSTEFERMDVSIVQRNGSGKVPVHVRSKAEMLRSVVSYAGTSFLEVGHSLWPQELPLIHIDEVGTGFAGGSENVAVVCLNPGAQNQMVVNLCRKAGSAVEIFGLVEGHNLVPQLDERCSPRLGQAAKAHRSGIEKFHVR